MTESKAHDQPDALDPSEDHGTAVAAPRYKCGVHGDIGNATIEIAFDHEGETIINRRLCMRCIDERILRHFPSLFEIPPE